MKEELKPYEGRKPYIFISYSHENRDEVEMIIGQLQRRGYRVWFDRGLHLGNKWSDELAGKIDDCRVFMLFLSRAYVTSEYCQEEFYHAKNEKKTMIPIYLERVELTGGLKMTLSRIQALTFENKQKLWDFLELAEDLTYCKEGATAAKESVPEGILSSLPSFAAIKAYVSEKMYSLSKLITLALCMLLVALIIVEYFFSGSPPAQSQPATETQTQTAAATTEPASTAASAPRTLSGNMLMEIPKPEGDTMEHDFAFGTSIARDQVSSIWFHGSLKLVPEDALDASQARDGSVMVWTEKEGELYQLHFAGEGGVDAPANSANLFRDMVNLNYIHFSDLFFTANTESMTCMFYRCEKLNKLDVTGFNTEKVKSFHMMFAGCKMLSGLDLSSFDTSSAVYMGFMFYNCDQIWKLDLGRFRTENVTDMAGMFYDCEALLSLDISSFDTGNVTDMSSMFCRCSALPQLDVSHFDTSNVTDMAHMFQGCSSLLELDVSGFDTAKVTDMSNMFAICSKVSYLDVSGFDTRHVTDMSYMFCNCANLESLDLSSFKTYNVTDMRYMFYNDAKLTELDFSGFYTDKVTSHENFMLENQKVHNLPWQGLFAGNP